MENKIQVKSLNSFYTVVATNQIKQGETIINITGIVKNSPDRYSIQINETEHLHPYSAHRDDPVSFWRFLNHSCEPNSFIDLKQMVLIALKDIPIDEEIRFNYNCTEFEVCSPFNCHCNSAHCIQRVKGFKYLSKEEQRMLSNYRATHLKTISTIHTL